MKVLVVGAGGQLGSEMVAVSKSLGQETAAIDYPEIDITNSDSTAKCVKSVSPELIVNCAAYTAVDDCETNEGLAYALNRDGPTNLARAAEGCGASMVHIGTDYVFDGKKGVPYTETDAPNPQSVYGKSKLAGEENLRDLLERHYIFRIAWLYGHQGKNFVKTIRRVAADKAAGGEPLCVVADQWGTPTYTRDVCLQVFYTVANGPYGLYHCTSEGTCSWFNFAERIISSAGIHVELQPCTTADFPRPAPRPPFGVLENEKLKNLGLNRMPLWTDAFAQFLSDEKSRAIEVGQE